ncbi:Long-chain-fatty-acid--CoA ligase 5 [Mortierella sp. AD031]|nr:Long-chain-fatty-acid--CoA ligase 5 [Mortierella sp. AD031]
MKSLVLISLTLVLGLLVASSDTAPVSQKGLEPTSSRPFQPSKTVVRMQKREDAAAEILEDIAPTAAVVGNSPSRPGPIKPVRAYPRARNSDSTKILKDDIARAAAAVGNSSTPSGPIKPPRTYLRKRDGEVADDIEEDEPTPSTPPQPAPSSFRKRDEVVADVVEGDELIRSGVSLDPENPLLGRRPWDPVSKTFGFCQWQTYRQVRDRVTRFGSGMVHLHQQVFGPADANADAEVAAQGWCVGLWSINRAEWIIASVAAVSYNALVGLYDSLGLETVVYGISYSECPIVVTSAGLDSRHAFWDGWLFNKVRMALGGRVERIMTASAPISAEVLSFIRMAFYVAISEAYGQTERSGGAAATQRGEMEAGHVRPPSPITELKLVDVLELNYFATDKPVWLHSGDIGFVKENGTLIVIDRIKNVFKLSIGEYVAVKKTDYQVASRLPIALQSFVHGDPHKNCLVSIFVLDPETFLAFANKVLFSAGSNANIGFTGKFDDAFRAACQGPKLRAVLSELTLAGSSAGLRSLLYRSFEIPKAVLIEQNPSTIESEMLTSTLKIKRLPPAA